MRTPSAEVAGSKVGLHGQIWGGFGGVEPITMVVAAIAAGAATGLSEASCHGRLPGGQDADG